MNELDSRHDTRYDHARRYLLGRLDDLERERFEAELVADEDASEAVLAAEDELIEEYARGELAPPDRAAFAARHLGRPGMDGRIAFARTLAEHARRSARSGARRSATADAAARGLFAWLPRPALRFAAAAAFALLVALTGWLGWRAAELAERVDTLQAESAAAAGRQAEIAELERQLAAARRQAAEARAEPAGETGADAGAAPGAATELATVRAHADRLAAELARLEQEASAAEPLAVSFVLSLATRSERGVRELAVPRQAELVRLQLDTGGEEGYAAYRVRLVGPGGGEVWSRTGAEQTTSAAGSVVEVTVPAEALAAGRHELLVEGLAGGEPAELVGAYEFDVVRR